MGKLVVLCSPDAERVSDRGLKALSKTQQNKVMLVEASSYIIVSAK